MTRSFLLAALVLAHTTVAATAPSPPGPSPPGPSPRFMSLATVSHVRVFKDGLQAKEGDVLRALERCDAHALRGVWPTFNRRATEKCYFGVVQELHKDALSLGATHVASELERALGYCMLLHGDSARCLRRASRELKRLVRNDLGKDGARSGANTSASVSQ